MSNTTQKQQTAEMDATLQDNFRIGERWAMIGVVGNLFLTAFKYVGGIVGHSAAMIADATHSASDILASGAVFLSMKVAKKDKDKEHPYGHGGAEIIATAIVAVLLIAAGLSILSTAINTLRSGEFSRPGVIAFIAAVVSIVTKEVMFRLTYRVGKKINSPALIADAWHHRSDVYSSIGTVIGIGGALLGFPVLDPIAAGLVSFFILHMAYSVIRTALSQIMGHSADEKVYAEIEKVANETEGVCFTDEIRAKETGPYISADVTIHVGKELTVGQGHDIARTTRQNLLQKVEHLYDVVIHVEPEHDPNEDI